MANSCACHHYATSLALLIFVSVVAVHVTDPEGQDQCPPFSCGDLHNISYPFRRPGDPHGCGEQAYELDCSSSKPTIHINKGMYLITDINYNDLSFWVVDANLDMRSSCLLPRWDHLPWGSEWESGSHSIIDLATATYSWACFVNCSQAVMNNSWYKHVTCQSLNNSFVYVYPTFDCGSVRYSEPSCMHNLAIIPYCGIGSLEPSCGYLAMIPFGSSRIPFPYPHPENATYADIIESVKKGFSVKFPSDNYWGNEVFRTCRNSSNNYFHEQISGTSILRQAHAYLWSDIVFIQCLLIHYISHTSISWAVAPTIYGISVTKLLVVLCRFVFVPLAVLTFVAYKFWKTRITIDAVEKFLQMHQMLGPIRFAYTDITAITSHFRDKLGQGGYGSVYKAVLLPGDVHVAVKMLGNSNCNGEEFISEVSTIGRIHHINVVRLVGFCAEEMRRALVYEYMPHGSLDKYIFSSERSFSWDKLNDIALGIARGINYLHRGCDMQILHFDIKPHNILLDSNFIPKVADFGLAKLYPRDESFVPASALRGTIGYIAPEMVSRSFGVISSKSDVYSFGMLLLEMAGGRRNADPNVANSSQAYYPAWVYDQLAKQEVGEISSSTVADMHELERKLCVVGLRCIQMKPHDRPTMSEVIEMLEYDADGLQMPSRPFFCDDDRITAAESYHFSSELTTISEEVE